MELHILQELMSRLAKMRPVFHSEADFQHAFAWKAHELLPAASIRLERHVLPGIHLDLSISLDGVVTAVELKYKTRALAVTYADEDFDLRQHGAQPPSRYDILNDVVRVERLVAEEVAHHGFVVVLTNDAGYWQEGRDDGGIGAAFRIHQGKRLGGHLGWGSATAPGTMRNREAALTLTGEYVTDWNSYSCVPGVTGAFRYLAIEVRAPTS